MATTKITSPDLFDLASLDSALKLPSGTTAERPTSPSTGEWRYNTDDNAIEFYDGSFWLTIQDEEIPAIPSENFGVVLYTGTSANHAITGLGFQPDLVWIKDRDNAEQHILNDSTRGASNDLSSNTTAAEANRPTGFLSFDSDGFTLGTDGGGVVNDSTRGPYVAWCWKANGGTTSSNTDGTITSTVQANTKAGFSIIKFTGTGATATVGHGLSQTPEIYIMKNLDQAGYKWPTHTQDAGSLSGNYTGALNETSAFTSYTPTANATTIGLTSGQPDRNPSGQEMIVYAFHSVAGYSKIGTYTGNGSTQAIDTGFEPAFLMLKSTSQTGDWFMFDNKRSPSNPRNNRIKANLADAESTSSNQVNFLTNGFYFGSTAFNDSGRTFLYIAFAADPSPAPVLADSFNQSLWTGNGGENTEIKAVGFQPGFVWLKGINAGWGNFLQDNIRTAPYFISSDSSNGEATTLPNIVSSFDTDGFTIQNNGNSNNQGSTYAAWSWKANSIPTINTDGTIQSVVSANSAAGFSVVKYTGNGTASSTIGHGLSSAPDVVFFKRLDAVESWNVWFSSVSNKVGFLNLAQGFITYTGLSSDSTTVTLNNGTGHNASNSPYIAYCFASTSGFSQIGTYTGNGTSQTITTGFQVDYILFRKHDANQDWFIFDSARDPINPKTKRLYANYNIAETSATSNINFTSTGFELTTSEFNDLGKNFVYMTFKRNITSEVIPAGEMAFLVVAGGGGGGYYSGGGGGGGGLRTSYGSTSGGGASAESNISLSAGTYTITVGAGGASSVQQNTNNLGANGTNSSITGLASISSIGGGGGAGSQTSLAGAAGGSGGGAAFYNGPNPAAGGAGTAGQGFDGASLTGTNGAGGGGAAGAGGAGGNTKHGGPGLSLSIEGYSTAYAGGGGGATNGSGGIGGGAYAGTGNSGAVNSGGGAGGNSGASGSGATGGSGVVILRLLTSEYSGNTTGSPTVTTFDNYTILKYTGSGTYVHS